MCTSGSWSILPSATGPDSSPTDSSCFPEISEENTMAPPKAPRGLDADLESNRFDEQNLRCLKPSGSLPALDLSKFPAKKILGLGKKTVNPGPKTPKTAELGMGKGTSTRRLRNSAPQIVRAPKPAEDEVPKLKGSMAFAHKARGMGDCYQTWAAGIEEKSPPSSTKGVNPDQSTHPAETG